MKNKKLLSSLRSLTKLKDWEMEQERATLMQLINRSEEIIESSRNLRQEILTQAKVAASDVNMLVFFGRYLTASRSKLDEFKQMSQTINESLQAAEILIKSHWNEKKTYEVLIKRRLKDMAEEIKLTEELISAEITTTRHIAKTSKSLSG